MELGSKRGRPVSAAAPAAPPPCTWTSSTWRHAADPGYDWGVQEQMVSKHVEIWGDVDDATIKALKNFC